MTDIRLYLKTQALLFDGSMGTYCSEIMPESIGSPCELLNLTNRQGISNIHKAYIAAGARAIKTNTFSASRVYMEEEPCREVIKAGFEIASEYRDSAFIFADIGPISATDEIDLFEEYTFVADRFIECGATNFLFETNSCLEPLPEVARYIKSKLKNAFIIVSFAALPDGFTRSGLAAARLINEADALDCFDAVGLNCASGARHMAKLISTLQLPEKHLCAMPNAGYPTVLGNRTYYDGSPAYFGMQIGEMATKGAKILGGCCGTTPEHIRAAAIGIANGAYSAAEAKPDAVNKIRKENKFLAELCDPECRPFAIELDPPENSDIEKFINDAKRLKASGASVITVADCPIGRARMDSSLLACKLKREFNIDVLPHMTCRDRNLNATKALLLGLCAEGVHNVLIVTGDPIPSASRDEVKSVYNFNSRMLASYITALGEESLATPFCIFGALNLNAHNFEVQLRLAAEKEANGICGFLTQPILTEQAYINLKRAREALSGKILGGIFPIVSYKNACFMNSEVAGIKVDERIIAMYDGKCRDEAETLALKISVEIADKIRPYVDGYYLMTPFSRTELVAKIMNEVK